MVAVEIFKSSCEQVDVVETLLEEDLSRHYALFLLRVVDHNELVRLVFLFVSGREAYILVDNWDESVSVEKGLGEVHG